MSILSSPEPKVLKESSSLLDQIEKLKEILPKASKPVQSVIAADINLLEMGLIGENKIMFELKNSHVPMYILHDVFLCKDDLTAQIDYLVICPKCTYVIECKNLVGDIEINSRGDFIRTISTGNGFKKEGIYSPITQNTRHLELMRSMQLDGSAKRIANAVFGDVFSATYIPVVVIANDKTVLNDRYAKKEVKDKIIRADQLISFIKQHEKASKEPKRTDPEMKASAEKWLSFSSENPVDYVEKYRKLEREHRSSLSASEGSEPAPICPSCGAKMVRRIAKTGARKGKSFWGCSNYPKCKQIINIQ